MLIFVRFSDELHGDQKRPHERSTRATFESAPLRKFLTFVLVGIMQEHTAKETTAHPEKDSSKWFTYLHDLGFANLERCRQSSKALDPASSQVRQT
jgi:hypothetical protein